jgi:hypothetical protein
MWNNIVQPDRPQMTIWRTRIACWIRQTTHTHTIRMCDAYSLSTVTVVAWMHLTISIYKHCLWLIAYWLPIAINIACLVFYLHPFSHMIPSLDVFRQNYACVYFAFYATSLSHFYLIAQAVLGECIKPNRDIIIGILTRLRSRGPRTRWRLSMGKRLSLFVSVQPHIQRVLGIRRPGHAPLRLWMSGTVPLLSRMSLWHLLRTSCSSHFACFQAET